MLFPSVHCYCKWLSTSISFLIIFLEDISFFSRVLGFSDLVLVFKAMVDPINCALCGLRLWILQITQ